MPHVRAGQLSLYCEAGGRGEPLVLVPGFGAGMWLWYRQVEGLARRFRVVAYDPRGMGRSPAPDAPFTVRDLADDLAALLDGLGVESAHVVGASFGGFVAQEFALAHPSRTRRLVLCCTSFGGPRHCPPAPETLERIASTKGLNTEDRLRENLLLAFSPAFVAREREEVARVIALRAAAPVPESSYARQLEAAFGFDAEARVGGIRAPTLVVTGDADRIVPHENSLNLAARIPGAALRVVHGGSHAFFIERPAEFNRIVSDFLASDA